MTQADASCGRGNFAQGSIPKGNAELPGAIAEILTRLESSGFAAWLVGGCVRDALLGRPIHDWDIASSAQPEQVMALFPKTVPTGARHGTVTVLHGGLSAEVTTFRADGDYADNRHPSSVRFVRRIEDDLARRDFTVNAMARNRAGFLLDLYGGQADLRAGILRCVGEPDRRFQEDALRMLRALRFSAQLGFAIEAQTREAIVRNAALSAALSAERVREEVEKTLCSPAPALVETMAQWGLLARFGLTRESLRPNALSALPALPPEPLYRWAGLLRAAPETCLEAFRLPRRIVRGAQQAVTACRPAFSDAQLRELAATLGPETARVTAALCGVSERLEEMLSSGTCCTLKTLAVRGGDFPDVHGAALGALLQSLLRHVWQHPEDNRRERLLKLAARLRGSSG